MCEERDASNNVTKRFFSQGEQINGTSYFFSHDHLGSVREMTDSSGNIQARYDYDLYGRVTKVQGTLDSDYQYAGMYEHATSGLNLTPIGTTYDPTVGRWVGRDPLGEDASLNLYAYVHNNPLIFIDPLGLLTQEAQALVDKALEDNNNNIYDAFNDLNQQRRGHEQCLPLRDAEHYLFAALETYYSGGTLVPFVAVLVPVYNASKENPTVERTLQLVGLIGPYPSPPSQEEVDAGNEGIQYGSTRLLIQSLASPN